MSTNHCQALNQVSRGGGNILFLFYVNTNFPRHNKISEGTGHECPTVVTGLIIVTNNHRLSARSVACDVPRSESPSGMCAKLRTVAASNNRVHPTRSLSSSPLASTINWSPASQALLEVTHQDHSIGITLLLLVHATYIWCYSSRTFRSW